MLQPRGHRKSDMTCWLNNNNLVFRVEATLLASQAQSCLTLYQLQATRPGLWADFTCGPAGSPLFSGHTLHLYAHLGPLEMCDCSHKGLQRVCLSSQSEPSHSSRVNSVLIRVLQRNRTNRIFPSLSPLLCPYPPPTLYPSIHVTIKMNLL